MNTTPLVADDVTGPRRWLASTLGRTLRRDRDYHLVNVRIWAALVALMGGIFGTVEHPAFLAGLPAAALLWATTNLARRDVDLVPTWYHECRNRLADLVDAARRTRYPEVAAQVPELRELLDQLLTVHASVLAAENSLADAHPDAFHTKIFGYRRQSVLLEDSDTVWRYVADPTEWERLAGARTELRDAYGRVHDAVADWLTEIDTLLEACEERRTALDLSDRYDTDELVAARAALLSLPGENEVAARLDAARAERDLIADVRTTLASV